MSSKSSSGLLFSTSSVAIGLLILLSCPTALAGKRLKQAEARFGIADTPKMADPIASHHEAEIGVDEWLDQERIVFISGEIAPDLAEQAISRLLYLDHKSPGKDIYLYINSPGGEITAGLAITRPLK